jgi:hypothetical protein
VDAKMVIHLIHQDELAMWGYEPGESMNQMKLTNQCATTHISSFWKANQRGLNTIIRLWIAIVSVPQIASLLSTGSCSIREFKYENVIVLHLRHRSSVHEPPETNNSTLSIDSRSFIESREFFY